MSEVHVIPVGDGGLGNSSYLLDLGDGPGLAVGARRDRRGLREVADRRRLPASIPLVGVEALDGARVLDIRQDSEYAAGHVPGAGHIELGALLDRAGEVPEERLVVMCGHSGRALGAASLFVRAGRHHVTVLDAAPVDSAEHNGCCLEVGR